jgi:hypothetical protein
MTMDQKKMFKQMIDFQKSTFDNSLNAMTTLQEQGEKMTLAFLDQAHWLPAEGKKVIKDWIEAYKTGRENFKRTVEENFDKVESFFAETGSAKSGGKS